MPGPGVQDGSGRALHDLAEVHDRHVICDVLHDREIVGDEEIREPAPLLQVGEDRKSTRLNSSHLVISYAVFCLKKKKKKVYEHADASARIAVDWTTVHISFSAKATTNSFRWQTA